MRRSGAKRNGASRSPPLATEKFKIWAPFILKKVLKGLRTRLNRLKFYQYLTFEYICIISVVENSIVKKYNSNTKQLSTADRKNTTDGVWYVYLTKHTMSKFNTENREELYALQREGYIQKEIAKKIGVNQSSVSRELKRKPAGSRIGYLPDRAGQIASMCRKQAKVNIPKWHKNDVLLKYVIDKLTCKSHYSPEQISGRIKLDYPDDKQMRVSHESIYKYIREDKRNNGELWKCLRQSNKKRKKRYGIKDTRGIIPNKKSIDERSKEVDEKKEYGHWEGDLIIGHKHNGAINTQVERKSKLLRAIKMKNKTSTEMVKATVKAYKDIPDKLLLTMTYDNGTEMAKHEEISKTLNMSIYFAHPYHSWERGLNENTNGLIRQYFPKKTDFTKITQRDLDEVVDAINDRPRKTLKYRTPNEVFKEIK